MKNIFYLLCLIAVLGCQKTETKNSEVEAFFDIMSEVECVDSLQNKFDLSFNYSTFIKEKMSFDYIIPDSIENSDFYNAYSGRIISAYYNLIAADTLGSFDNLLNLDTCDNDLAMANIIKYCAQNKTWNGVFNLAHSSFYGENPIDKPVFTIDSLINISMSYFYMAGYSQKRGFAFHFVCGSNPIKFEYENKTALLICDFCQEALKNPAMWKAHKKIIKDIRELIKEENDTIENFKTIKQAYEPTLHRLLKDEIVLKESLIAYYEERKDIEPFILQY